MTTTTTPARINQLANVTIPMADVDLAIEFFTGPLGLEKRTDLPFGRQYRWVEVAPPGATPGLRSAAGPRPRRQGRPEHRVTQMARTRTRSRSPP